MQGTTQKKKVEEMLKIKKNIFMDGTYAGYNPVKNIIYYDEDLNRFPDFKKKIIAHELKHSNKPKNVIYHLITDFIDYFKIHFTKRAYDFYNYKRIEVKKYGVGKSFIYSLFNEMFRQIIITPALLFYYVFLTIKHKFFKR